MLVGYPSTMVGTDVSTETGRMRLRMYLGSVLYRPENVMILPDVSWDGLKAIRKYELQLVDAKNAAVTDVSTIVNGITQIDMPANSSTPAKMKFKISGKEYTINQVDSETSLTGVFKDFQEDIEGLTIYQAATFDNDDLKPLLVNTGHLGCLDSPECGDKVYGTQVYTKSPSAI